MAIKPMHAFIRSVAKKREPLSLKTFTIHLFLMSRNQPTLSLITMN